MADIAANFVKELREKTGAGMMDCKRALTETGGSLEKAIDYLRTKGLADAAKKATRIATEGMVHSYIHAGGKVGVLLEVNCETDFVARTDEFKNLCNDLALHICASQPKYVSKDEIDPLILKKEEEIYTEKAKLDGKPKNIIPKIVEGQLKKFADGVSLLTQPFVKNPDITVEGYISEKIAKIGENIKVRRFVRFQLGEGLEKKQENFLEEVKKQVGTAYL
jgi:elongation factor Ts